MKYMLAIFLMLFTLITPTQALTINSLYGDITQSNTNAENLISIAYNYETFKNSDYVLFRNEQNSYYIVWGELENNNDNINGQNIEYIRYYRPDSVGTNYIYEYGTDNQFTLNPNYLVVSNINGIGAKSLFYEDLLFNDVTTDLLTFGVGILLGIYIVKLRR